MYVESKDGNDGIVEDNFMDSDESLNNIHLDDNMEERANGIDDGFEVAL